MSISVTSLHLIYVIAVDEAFRTLLDDIFGSDVMEEYRKKRPAGYRH